MGNRLISSDGPVCSVVCSTRRSEMDWTCTLQNCCAKRTHFKVHFEFTLRKSARIRPDCVRQSNGGAFLTHHEASAACAAALCGSLTCSGWIVDE